MPIACWALLSAMPEMMLATLLIEATISLSDWPARLTRSTPSLTWAVELVIRSLMSLAACDERWARLRTSVATTANPRPASPARAASTAALRARRLVWKAISLMSLMISLVPSAEARIRAMAPCIWSMAAVPSAAAPLALCASAFACWALSADCRVVAEGAGVAPGGGPPRELALDGRAGEGVGVGDEGRQVGAHLLDGVVDEALLAGERLERGGEVPTAELGHDRHRLLVHGDVAR